VSKCTGCDQHNAVIYHNEDMYCEDCYEQHIYMLDIIHHIQADCLIYKDYNDLDEEFDSED